MKKIIKSLFLLLFLLLFLTQTLAYEYSDDEEFRLSYMLELAKQGYNEDSFQILCGDSEVLFANFEPIPDYDFPSAVCTLDSENIKGVAARINLYNSNSLQEYFDYLNSYFISPNEDAIELSCDINDLSVEGESDYIDCSSGKYDVYVRLTSEGFDTPGFDVIVYYGNQNTLWDHIKHYFIDLFGLSNDINEDQLLSELRNAPGWNKGYYAFKKTSYGDVSLVAYKNGNHAVLNAKGFTEEITGIGESRNEPGNNGLQFIKFDDISDEEWALLLTKLDITRDSSSVINEELGCGDNKLYYPEECDGDFFKGNKMKCSDYESGADDTLVTCVSPDEVGECTVNLTACILCEDVDGDGYFTSDAISGDLRYLRNPKIGSLFLTSGQSPLSQVGCSDDCSNRRDQCEYYCPSGRECASMGGQQKGDCLLGVRDCIGACDGLYDSCLRNCETPEDNPAPNYLDAQIVPLTTTQIDQDVEDLASVAVDECDSIDCFENAINQDDIINLADQIDFSDLEESTLCVWDGTLNCQENNLTNLGYFINYSELNLAFEESYVEPIFLLELNLQEAGLENNILTPNYEIAYTCGALAKKAQSMWDDYTTTTKLINNFILLSDTNAENYNEAYLACQAGIKKIGNNNLYYDLPENDFSYDNEPDGFVIYDPNYLIDNDNFSSFINEINAKTIFMPTDFNQILTILTLNPNYLLLKNTTLTDDQQTLITNITNLLDGNLYAPINNNNMLISNITQINILSKETLPEECEITETTELSYNYYIYQLNNWDCIFEVKELYCPDNQLNQIDCNPFDPEVYPGAEELCDGKDNDCDNDVDEGCLI